MGAAVPESDPNLLSVPKKFEREISKDWQKSLVDQPRAPEVCQTFDGLWAKGKYVEACKKKSASKVSSVDQMVIAEPPGEIDADDLKSLWERLGAKNVKRIGELSAFGVVFSYETSGSEQRVAKVMRDPNFYSEVMREIDFALKRNSYAPKFANCGRTASTCTSFCT